MIYVVAKGEYGEGHDPVAAEITLNEARRTAHHLYGVWPSERVDANTWKESLNGTDEVLIVRLRIGGRS